MTAGHGSRPRWLLWWTLVERTTALATHPKADVPAADAAIEAVVARSAVGRAADRMMRLATRWYADSYTGRALMSLDREWTALDAASRVRSAGAGLAIAAVTTLALERLGTPRAGFWSAIVPVLCAVIGALAVAFAASISRTVGNTKV